MADSRARSTPRAWWLARPAMSRARSTWRSRKFAARLATTWLCGPGWLSAPAAPSLAPAATPRSWWRKAASCPDRSRRSRPRHPNRKSFPSSAAIDGRALSGVVGHSANGDPPMYDCTRIEGKLITRTAFVHGQVRGLVFAEHVTVEPTGRVDGVIFCRKLTVLGSVRANVICDNVLGRHGGRLSAALKYRTIKIEPGGMVGGKFQRRVIIDGQARTPAASAGIQQAV